MVEIFSLKHHSISMHLFITRRNCFEIKHTNLFATLSTNFATFHVNLECCHTLVPCHDQRDFECECVFVESVQINFD